MIWMLFELNVAGFAIEIANIVSWIYGRTIGQTHLGPVSLTSPGDPPPPPPPSMRIVQRCELSGGNRQHRGLVT